MELLNNKTINKMSIDLKRNYNKIIIIKKDAVHTNMVYLLFYVKLKASAK